MIRTTLLGALAIATAIAQQQPSQPPVQPADFTRALADYGAGRFAAAYESFAALLAAQGDAAPAALRWNAALAALRVQRSGDAESAVLPWLDAADAGQRADAEFVNGLAAVQRAERAAAAARLPDAEPMAWTIAIDSMRRGLAAFVRAATLRADWPEARRNAERAQRAVRGLERERDASKPPAPKQEKPQPPQPQPPAPGQQPEDAPAEPVVDALSPADVAQLLQRLQQKDTEKRNVRRAASRVAAVAGERSW